MKGKIMKRPGIVKIETDMPGIKIRQIITFKDKIIALGEDGCMYEIKDKRKVKK